MTDVLCHMKEKALKEVNPKLFTWATLTGHVIIAHGDKYSVSLSPPQRTILSEHAVILPIYKLRSLVYRRVTAVK